MSPSRTATRSTSPATARRRRATGRSSTASRSSTLKKERLFRCDEGRFERFLAFAGASRRQALVRSESKTDPPNLYVVDLASGARRKLTDYRDPTPQLTRVTKELVQYAREDGVPLSGTLYLPPGYAPGTRLPALVWAYPLEYSDARPPARCAAPRTPSPASPAPRRSPS